MARTLPVAVSAMSSLPVPVVGVLSGMLILGERPGPSEFIALALVMASLAAVLFDALGKDQRRSNAARLTRRNTSRRPRGMSRSRIAFRRSTVTQVRESASAHACR